MIKPANGRTGNLQALLDGKIDTPVGNNDVATLCKHRHHARYCREALGVENRGFCTEEVCHVALKVHVDICKPKPFVTERAHSQHRDAPIIP